MLLNTRKRNNDQESTGMVVKRPKPLLVPVSVWKNFPRLKLALEYSVSCFQDVAVFAYESKESTSTGGRRFLVSTYYEFGQRYILMKSPRHFYEVITEGAVCHLYFDLEYNIPLNPSTDSLSVLAIFKQYVSCQLKLLFNISCSSSHVLDMDSTTNDKFSRHLVYHLEGAAFRNNLIVGEFVKYICDRLKALRDCQSNMNYQDIIHLNRGKYKCSCPSSKELLQLFITTSKGVGLICDEGVYTRNRNFRLLLSSKKGKKMKLTVSKESCFKSSHAVDCTKRKRSKLFNNLMDSLICNVRFETTSTILDSPFQANQRLDNPSKPVRGGGGNSATPHKRVGFNTATPHEGGGANTTTPYPLLDQFIASQLVRDGMTGRIREWTYFNQGKLIVYEIFGYRWCENIGRHHKSNNIMIVADLKTSSFYQKCHDPECRRANFRSNSYPIPHEVIGLCSEENVVENKEVSEMRRILLSDFSDNDSFVDDTPPVTSSWANKREDDSLLLVDLSVEDLLGTQSEHDELEWDISCGQDGGMFLENLSYEDVFGDGYLSDELSSSQDNKSNVRLSSSKQSGSDQMTFQSTVSNVSNKTRVCSTKDVKSENTDSTIVAGTSNDNEAHELMLHNLSYEELFDTGNSSCDDDTVNELIGDLSAEDIFDNIDSPDSPIATNTAFTSTPIKQEPLDLNQSHDSHVTHPQVTIKEEEGGDYGDILSLSQQEMKSFLDCDD